MTKPLQLLFCEHRAQFRLTRILWNVYTSSLCRAHYSVQVLRTLNWYCKTGLRPLQALLQLKLSPVENSDLSRWHKSYILWCQHSPCAFNPNPDRSSTRQCHPPHSFKVYTSICHPLSYCHMTVRWKWRGDGKRNAKDTRIRPNRRGKYLIRLQKWWQSNNWKTAVQLKIWSTKRIESAVIAGWGGEGKGKGVRPLVAVRSRPRLSGVRRQQNINRDSLNNPLYDISYFCSDKFPD